MAVSGTTVALPEARTVGTDGLAFGQLMAARKAARHLLDCGVLEPTERGTLAQISPADQSRDRSQAVDLDATHQRWPGWRLSHEGEELAARSTVGLCTLRAASPEALEAEVRREEQTWASVRAFAASLH